MRSVTFETGLSDHHKLTATILRTTISKGSFKKMFYKGYKKLDQKKFETELKLKCSNKLELLHLPGSAPSSFKQNRAS